MNVGVPTIVDKRALRPIMKITLTNVLEKGRSKKNGSRLFYGQRYS
jgi:hypothetical protein